MAVNKLQDASAHLKAQSRLKTSKAANKRKDNLVLAASDPAKSFDELIHERNRLAIVSALAVNECLTFNDLKSLLALSDGNLSAHARKLEDAGYIDCQKSFEGRMPRTHYRLTTKGSRALQSYLGHMEALITAVKKS